MATQDDVQNLLPSNARFEPSIWQPIHMDDPPEPPPPDTREADLAALAAQEKLGHDGKRQRVRARRTVDPFGGLERWKIFRTTKSSIHYKLFMRSNPNYTISLLPPAAYTNRSTSLCTRYAHTSTNKIRCPVNIVKWTPDARRVLTGSTSGEFTLWNGLTFNFETILQAHDTAVRAMEWSYSGQWLISADNTGTIKYFQTNMNNLQVFQGHQESIRDVTWAPNDQRFATGSDDGTIKIWNFEMMKEEKTLTGHGWDVKCVKWHPTKGLLVSGSKDNLIKFWDPRTSQVLTTLHGHKNTVQAAAWSPSGNLVATASRDQLVKVFDIRAMKELATLRGHKKEVCSVAWHPIHDDILVSGGSEGSIIHWSMPDQMLKDQLEFAHDSNVWSLAFHPLGHILCSASNDHTTRFWSRNRPGQKINGDRFHVGKDKAREMGTQEEVDDIDDFVPGLNNFRSGGQGGGFTNRGGHHGGGGGGQGFNRGGSGFNNAPANDGFIPGFGRGHDDIPSFAPQPRDFREQNVGSGFSNGDRSRDRDRRGPPPNQNQGSYDRPSFGGRAMDDGPRGGGNGFDRGPGGFNGPPPPRDFNDQRQAMNGGYGNERDRGYERGFDNRERDHGFDREPRDYGRPPLPTREDYGRTATMDFNGDSRPPLPGGANGWRHGPLPSQQESLSQYAGGGDRMGRDQGRSGPGISGYQRY